MGFLTAAERVEFEAASRRFGFAHPDVDGLSGDERTTYAQSTMSSLIHRFADRVGNANFVDHFAKGAGLSIADAADAKRALGVMEAGGQAKRTYTLPSTAAGPVASGASSAATSPPLAAAAPKPVAKAVARADHPERAEREQALLRMPAARGCDSLVALLANDTTLSFPAAQDVLFVARGERPRYEKRAASSSTPVISSASIYQYRSACATAHREGRPVPSWDEFEAEQAAQPSATADPRSLYQRRADDMERARAASGMRAERIA